MFATLGEYVCALCVCVCVVVEMCICVGVTERELVVGVGGDDLEGPEDLPRGQRKGGLVTQHLLHNT